MGNDFFIYLQRLELLAFFSGYPLIYAMVFVMAGNKKTGFTNRLIMVLPKAYAMVGVLFMGLQLKKLYPDYSFQHIKTAILLPSLVIWGFLSILFFIPALGKKTIFSLLHSLIFFYFLVKDLFLQFITVNTDKDIVRNDMKMYTISLLLNLVTVGFLLLLQIYLPIKKRGMDI